jgi:CDP-diacylglycerol--glycerol-3-phosphate 3-phosphatidyltransferase
MKDTENTFNPQPPAGLSDRLRQWSGQFLSPLVRLLARLGLTPNWITTGGLVFNAGVAVLLAKGYLAWGGGLMLLAGIFDTLDGSLARLTGQSTSFGAFLDSTFDRYSEACVFAGLAWFYLGTGRRLEVMLIVASLVGSIMVSYTRARAEGLGIECKGGLLTRLERVVIVGAALLTGLVTPMLWLMAVLTHVTVAQRVWSVWQAEETHRPGK